MKRIGHVAVAASLALTLLPTLAQAEDEAPVVVGRKKVFTLKTEDGQFSLGITGRLQGRWEAVYLRGDDSELTDRFLLPAARLGFEGKLRGTTEFKAQIDVGKGVVTLKDYYFDHPIGGPAWVRVGQYKKPFAREQINSSGNLQMVTRSAADKFSGSGRDLGVIVHNEYDKSPNGLEWAVGVFNGLGEAPVTTCKDATMPQTCTASNVPHDIGPQAVARVGWNHGGIKGYSEADLEGGPLRFAVAAAYMLDFKDGKSELFEHRVGLDFIAKVCGFSAAGGAYLVDKTDTDGKFEFGDQFAGFLQAGFMVTKKMEVSARGSQVPIAGGEHSHEILVGYSWYGAGHAWKWQTQAGVIHDTGSAGGTDKVLSTQAQLVF